MAWSALARSWNAGRKGYDTLVFRIEEPENEGCLIRLYKDDTVIAEATGETPQIAIAAAVQIARQHLPDAGITVQDLVWIQV